jgi:23S rRNA (guanine745-N1)-methyltransferase
LPLARADGRVTCPRAHSFDIARSGYINLLQPQDRTSARPGDSAKALDARRRFLAQGYETPLTEAILGHLTPAAGDAVLDVGCGEGDFLAALVAHFGCDGHGVDISTHAIDAAARRHPGLHWIVANADRFLPYADATFHLVASVTARKNAPEFRRVLADGGTLVIVIPAPDDLIELRTAILGEGIARDRVESTRESLGALFTLARHERMRHAVRLQPDALRDVMALSYRGLRDSQRTRLAALGETDVTLSRDVLLFRPV